MNTKDKRQNLSTKLAYIAGFVDGEGCIRIKKSNQSGNSYYITFQVTNTDEEPLELMQEVFCCGKVYFQEKGTNKIVWQYYATCNDAVDICKALIGFSKTKKTQMELAIIFHDNQHKLNPNEKLSLYKEMKQLKIIGNIHENKELLNESLGT